MVTTLRIGFADNPTAELAITASDVTTQEASNAKLQRMDDIVSESRHAG